MIKKSLLCLLMCGSAFADPAVKNVQVSIHNDTEYLVEFKSFDTSRLLANTRFAEARLQPFFVADYAIVTNAFDQEPVTAGVNIEYNGKKMKLMWQTNMGFGGPDEPKSHLCGVVRDGRPDNDHNYCDIPYVDGNTLYINFYLNQGTNIEVLR